MNSTELRERSAHLIRLLDVDPAEAVRQARLIGPNEADRPDIGTLRASILVDGGRASGQRDAVEEGLRLFRDRDNKEPSARNAYNLANALAALTDLSPDGPGWLDHQERTRYERAEARRLYWRVAEDAACDAPTRTQAWTNLGLQFQRSFRFGEAHDARLAALVVDPKNGAAAGAAAEGLLWLFEQGGCSELTRIEACMLAKVAKRNEARLVAYAGTRARDRLVALADELDDPPSRAPHADPFVRWLERERLTLAPVAELVDPTLDKLDWLMLPDISEREPGKDPIAPPPVFAMFNVLKSDFLIARDLVWRATGGSGWAQTGRFASTFDYAVYGPDTSALVTGLRAALDLLDKVAVTANHYFEIGLKSTKVKFDSLWRPDSGRKNGTVELATPVQAAIRGGATALFGLAELAEDYCDPAGILNPQKELRNAGTHRFVVLHEVLDQAVIRDASGVTHLDRERFAHDALRALRVARSAIQMLRLSIVQHERVQRRSARGPAFSILVPDCRPIRKRRKVRRD